MKEYYYVYKITNKLNEVNGGVRWYIGQRKSKIPPEEDLGVKYFSSSKILKEEIKTLGREHFRFEILKVFESSKEALDYEVEIHNEIDVASNPLFYNRANQTSSGFIYYPEGYSDNFKESNETRKVVAELISPTGKTYIIRGIRNFCERKGLDNSNIIKVLKGKRKSHKGWRGKYVVY